MAKTLPPSTVPLSPEQKKMHDWIKGRVQEAQERAARKPTWAEYLLPIVMVEEHPVEWEDWVRGTQKRSDDPCKQ